MTCAHCGSPHIQFVAGTYPTGVVAPDGGREYRDEQGWHCRDCGAVEDECDE